MELKAIRQGSVEAGEYWVYDAEDVDAALVSKDKEIAELKKKLADEREFGLNRAKKDAVTERTGVQVMAELKLTNNPCKFCNGKIDDDEVRFLGAIDCKKCPAKETCTVDYWKGCGDNFMEWAKSEA